jgi:hypothetical protein
MLQPPQSGAAVKNMPTVTTKVVMGQLAIGSAVENKPYFMQAHSWFTITGCASSKKAVLIYTYSKKSRNQRQYHWRIVLKNGKDDIRSLNPTFTTFWLNI